MDNDDPYVEYIVDKYDNDVPSEVYMFHIVCTPSNHLELEVLSL